MKVKFNGELRKVTAGKEFTKKDGGTGKNYYLLVETESDSLQFPTTADLYKRFENGELYKGCECAFVADYNPRYQFNNFVVEEALVQ